MTVGELILDLKNLPENEEVVILLEDGPKTEPEDWESLEPGSVCDISEAGGYVSGMRVIRAVPRA